MKFEYTTHRGTKVELEVISSTNIKIKANGKTFISRGKFAFDYTTTPPTPALSTDYKQSGKVLNIGITEEIRNYIRQLKEEERIAKLTRKEQIKEQIKKLKTETTSTYLVDKDLVTGLSWFTLTKRVDKKTWKSVSHFFTYIDTTYHSDDFDSMYESKFKGYATIKPAEVDAILCKDKEEIEEKIKKLEEELAKIEYKEKNDTEYRRKIFTEDFNRLKEKYQNIDLSELEKKLSGLDLIKIKDNNLCASIIVDLLLEEEKGYEGCIYNPKELPKIVSSSYAGGYHYFHKDNHDIAVIPTKKYIVVAHRPKYSKEFGNDMINGFFALFGVCYIRVYKRVDKILNLLNELGLKSTTYYENSSWFIMDNKLGYKNDFTHINTLSDDYNYIENEEKVLSKYKSEKRWEWNKGRFKVMPTPEEIKYIGKFKVLK